MRTCAAFCFFVSLAAWSCGQSAVHSGGSGKRVGSGESTPEKKKKKEKAVRDDSTTNDGASNDDGTVAPEPEPVVEDAKDAKPDDSEAHTQQDPAPATVPATPSCPIVAATQTVVQTMDQGIGTALCTQQITTSYGLCVNGPAVSSSHTCDCPATCPNKTQTITDFQPNGSAASGSLICNVRITCTN